MGLREHLAKSRVELSPEQLREVRERLRGQDSRAAEDNPGAREGYVVMREGEGLHGVHRVGPSGKVDARTSGLYDDADEATEQAEEKSAEEAAKSQGTRAALARAAGAIRHCNDYGYGFWNPRTQTVWWVAGDADAPENGYTSGQEIRELLRAVPGVKEVRVEYEGFPEQHAGWQKFQPSVMKSNILAHKDCPCCAGPCTCPADCPHCDCNEKPLVKGVSRHQPLLSDRSPLNRAIMQAGGFADMEEMLHALRHPMTEGDITGLAARAGQHRAFATRVRHLQRHATSAGDES